MTPGQSQPSRHSVLGWAYQGWYKSLPLAPLVPKENSEWGLCVSWDGLCTRSSSYPGSRRWPGPSPGLFPVALMLHIGDGRWSQLRVLPASVSQKPPWLLAPLHSRMYPPRELHSVSGSQDSYCHENPCNSHKFCQFCEEMLWLWGKGIGEAAVLPPRNPTNSRVPESTSCRHPAVRAGERSCPEEHLEDRHHS